MSPSVRICLFVCSFVCIARNKGSHTPGCSDFSQCVCCSWPTFTITGLTNEKESSSLQREKDLGVYIYTKIVVDGKNVKRVVTTAIYISLYPFSSLVGCLLEFFVSFF